MTLPAVECPACGSEDTELTPLVRRGSPGWLSRIGKVFKEEAEGRKIPKGQYTLTCKKCGHKTLIYFN